MQYKLFRNDRDDRVGGGVVVYVKEYINCSHRADLQIGSLECVWLELKLHNKTYLYGTFYIPPNSTQQTWDNVYYSIDLALACNMELIITGDFNINQNKKNPNDKIQTLLTNFSLHQLIKDNTYYTETNSSLLDLIIVNCPQSIILSQVGAPLLDNIRYHLPVLGVINSNTSKNHSFKRKIYYFDRGDYNSLRQKLSIVNWNSLFVPNDIDCITSNITKTILDIADKVIPNRIITINKNDPPWITSDVKKAIRKKNRSHKKAKETKTPYYWAKFRKIRNKCNSVVKNAKINYYKQLSEKILQEKSNSKNWSKIMKSLLDSHKDKEISHLLVGNDIITDHFGIANTFNKYFNEQSNLDDSAASLPNFDTIPNSRLSDLQLTETEVEDILKTLDTSKAIGPDLVSPKLLKEASSILKSPLCRLFNLSLTAGKFPSDWKKANIIPVFKKDSPIEVSNY